MKNTELDIHHPINYHNLQVIKSHIKIIYHHKKMYSHIQVNNQNNKNVIVD
jgi:hypothetical protein